MATNSYNVVTEQGHILATGFAEYSDAVKHAAQRSADRRETLRVIEAQPVEWLNYSRPLPLAPAQIRYSFTTDLEG